MRGVNKVILIGNLGKEPEVTYLEGNIAIAKFPLATSDSIKDKNGNFISQTEWHNVVVWRQVAEMAMKQLHKGSLVYVEGRLRTRTWEDRNKIRHSSTEIVGDNIVVLEKRKDQNDTINNEIPQESSAFGTKNFDGVGKTNNIAKDDFLY